MTLSNTTKIKHKIKLHLNLVKGKYVVLIMYKIPFSGSKDVYSEM